MTNKMVVYRVEDRFTGTGPYQGVSNSSYVLSDAHASHVSSAHPAWAVDGISPRSNYGGGFDSLDKLMSWFAGHMDMLIEEGFIIRVFWVNPADVFFGDSGKQLAFPRW